MLGKDVSLYERWARPPLGRVQWLCVTPVGKSVSPQLVRLGEVGPLLPEYSTAYFREGRKVTRPSLRRSQGQRNQDGNTKGK